MKDNQKVFKPLGPFEVDFENLPGGKRITKDHVKNFWNTRRNLERIRHGKGIYVFGMKVAAGIIPCYIGKTNNSFEKECFTDRNINIYNGEIIRYARNYKPFLFFLIYEQRKGKKVSDKVLRELERHVINLASEKNTDLANIRGFESENHFFIAGLGGGGRGGGAPTREGSFFKRMINY